MKRFVFAFFVLLLGVTCAANPVDHARVIAEYGIPVIHVVGTLKAELYARDRLHLNPDGYQVWSKEIANII